MDKDNVVFPRAFRGYERKAVNEYILRTDREFTQEIEALKTQLDALNSELAEKTKRLDEVSSLAEKQRSDLDKAAEAAEDLKKRLSEANAENASLKDSYEKELARMKDDCEKIRSEYAEKIAAIENERDSALDELKRTKEELDVVRTERDKLIYDRKLEEESGRKELESDLNAYREKISRELRETTKKCLREILTGLGGMRDDLGALSVGAEDRAKRMLDSIDSFEDEMKAEVRKILSDFES